jgi:putative oxygen-independent coproporphyrinogen III oxidase
MSTIPLSLYIHMPWCIKKCPYCDFNSHKKPSQLPEEDYIHSLINDLSFTIEQFSLKNRELTSIFIGGGTPSLFSAKAYETVLNVVANTFVLPSDIEITLEANPSASEASLFKTYRSLGINRLSIGIQSFQNTYLSTLGRVHSADEAMLALQCAKAADFQRINLDLMYGLPNQTVDDAMFDLEKAFSFDTTHVSWYQLTLEPNTLFYKTKPVLPSEIILDTIEERGYGLFDDYGFERYEVSAYAKNKHYSKHNLNYWTFGDYIGIGAGSHGKITNLNPFQITRTHKHRIPDAYMKQPALDNLNLTVKEDAIPFEFMLNATRLHQPIPFDYWLSRTPFSIATLARYLDLPIKRGLIVKQDNCFQVTALGRRFTNDLQALFLKSDD